MCSILSVFAYVSVSAVSAETLQRNIEQMGRQIKNLEKDLETFPPPQSDKDLFVEKMSISFLFNSTLSLNNYTIA